MIYNLLYLFLIAFYSIPISFRGHWCYIWILREVMRCVFCLNIPFLLPSGGQKQPWDIFGYTFLDIFFINTTIFGHNMDGWHFSYLELTFWLLPREYYDFMQFSRYCHIDSNYGEDAQNSTYPFHQTFRNLLKRKRSKTMNATARIFTRKY